MLKLPKLIRHSSFQISNDSSDANTARVIVFSRLMHVLICASLVLVLDSTNSVIPYITALNISIYLLVCREAASNEPCAAGLRPIELSPGPKQTWYPFKIQFRFDWRL